MDELIKANTDNAISLHGQVRKLTENAGFDPLSNADYDEIYRRLREWDERTGKYGKTMYECEKIMKAAYPDAPSRAELQRWENGEIEARRRLRNGLRAADGRPLLPDTVVDTVAQHAHPDSAVYFIGEGEIAEHVLLVGSVAFLDASMGTDTTNGAIDAAPPRTKAQRTYYRPCLSGELKELVEDSGESVEELIRYALDMKRREI